MLVIVGVIVVIMLIVDVLGFLGLISSVLNCCFVVGIWIIVNFVCVLLGWL